MLAKKLFQLSGQFVAAWQWGTTKSGRQCSVSAVRFVECFFELGEHRRMFRISMHELIETFALLGEAAVRLGGELCARLAQDGLALASEVQVLAPRVEAQRARRRAERASTGTVASESVDVRWEPR
ncbi:MAG: hypothetical protein AAB327_01885, partial [Actinomycetota bacterium]